MMIRKAVLFLLLFIMLWAGCAPEGPSAGEDGNVSLFLGGNSKLTAEILAARSSLKVALYRIPDPAVLLALNEAASRGVAVDVVVDSDNWESASGLHDSVGIRYGNNAGGMYANFLVTDSSRALILSSTEYGSGTTMMASITSEKLAAALSTEFRQMFDSNLFGGTANPKNELNQQRIFMIGEHVVALYMLPQNDVFVPLVSRIGQSGNGVRFYGPYMENETVYNSLSGIRQYGSGLSVRLGPSASSMMTNCGNILLWQETETVTNAIPGTGIICDPGSPDSTAIISTFPLDGADALGKSDGLLLMVTGPAAGQIDRTLHSRYSATTDNASVLTIGSFNIRDFGIPKANDSEIASILVRIATNFDILAVQEFSDITGQAPRLFLAQLNTPVSNYALLDSGPVGNEQYAFYYRVDRVNLASPVWIYPDAGGVFSRPPYMAHFRSSDTTIDFVLATVHIVSSSSGDPGTEIMELTNVIEEAKAHFTEQDVIVLGDMNADEGQNFDPAQLASIFPASKYITVVPTGVDTTVSNTTWETYDRIQTTVSCSEFMTGEWGVLKFDREYSFRSLSIEPLNVSDHYPVWFRLKTGQDSD